MFMFSTRTNQSVSTQSIALLFYFFLNLQRNLQWLDNGERQTRSEREQTAKPSFFVMQLVTLGVMVATLWHSLCCHSISLTPVLFLFSFLVVYTFSLGVVLLLSSLQIEISGIPAENGKCRVETQLKITVHLKNAEGQTVGDWKQLRLPRSLIAKEKHRMEKYNGKLELKGQKRESRGRKERRKRTGTIRSS